MFPCGPLANLVPESVPAGWPPVAVCGAGAVARTCAWQNGPVRASNASNRLPFTPYEPILVPIVYHIPTCHASATWPICHWPGGQFWALPHTQTRSGVITAGPCRFRLLPEATGWGRWRASLRARGGRACQSRQRAHHLEGIKDVISRLQVRIIQCLHDHERKERLILWRSDH